MAPSRLGLKLASAGGPVGRQVGGGGQGPRPAGQRRGPHDLAPITKTKLRAVFDLTPGKDMRLIEMKVF